MKKRKVFLIILACLIAAGGLLSDGTVQQTVAASKRQKALTFPRDTAAYIRTFPQQLTAKQQIDLKLILEKGREELRQKGWSDQAIVQVFWENPDKKVASSQLGQLFTKRLTESQLFGSKVFQALWGIDAKKLKPTNAKRLLKMAVTTVALPDDLSGTKEETQHLLSRFSKELSPDDSFWSDFSKAVRVAYPKLSFAKGGVLERKLHQFRYVISAQQAQWVRDNYRKQGMSDAQALAHHMRDLDEANTLLEKIGVSNSDYYYDYQFGESSRLHNKLAIDSRNINRVQKYLPDGKRRVNFKIVMHFYTEFILDNEGHFVNELDPEGTNENGVINGASFNYASENNRQHRYLDVYLTKTHDPQFRRNYMKKNGIAYKAPNKVGQPFSKKRRSSWTDSYFNSKGVYAFKGRSMYQSVKAEIEAYKKLVEGSKS